MFIIKTKKGKKGAARNRSCVGNVNGATGVVQRRSSEASKSEVVIFNAAPVSTEGKNGWVSSISKPRQVGFHFEKSSEAAVPGLVLGSADGMCCEASEGPGRLAETGGGAGSFCNDEVHYSHSVAGEVSTNNGCLTSIPCSGDGAFTTPESAVSMDKPDGMVLEGGGDMEEPQC